VHLALAHFDDTVPAQALKARLGSTSLFDVAREVLTISRGGLKRRNRLNGDGVDEHFATFPFWEITGPWDVDNDNDGALDIYSCAYRRANRLYINERRESDGKLQFSFQFAPWKDVIDWFAQQSDLSLIGDKYPSGTFNYRDPRNYTPAEALDVLAEAGAPVGMPGAVEAGRKRQVQQAVRTAVVEHAPAIVNQPETLITFR
jgi:hypothetical protein